MDNKIFTYGTLMDKEVQLRIWGRLTPGIADSLSGYAKSEIETSAGKYPLIIPDATNSVSGSIIEISGAELKKIDEYEGSEYKRVKIITDKGESAWVYIKR